MTNQQRLGQDMLEEWKIAMQTAMHFNDLLMRLRTFGTPIVVSIMGAGLVFGLDRIFPKFRLLLILALALSITIGLFVFTCWLIHRANWGKGPVELKEREKLLWWSFPAVTLLWFLYYLIESIVTFVQSIPQTPLFDVASRQYSIALVIGAFALALLLGLYVLDRFYYYKLLIGAVTRLTELERGHLGYRLTQTITDTTPEGRSATLITILYWLPGFIGYCFLLVLTIVDVKKLV